MIRSVVSYGPGSMMIEADMATAGLLSAFVQPSAGGILSDLSLRLSSGSPDPRAAADPGWQVGERWSRGEQLRVRRPGGARMIFDPFSRSVSTLAGQGQRATGSIWFDTAQAFEPWVLAAPGLQLLDWVAIDRDMLATHAAGICFGEAGVLLIGPGGSGKSTFATEAAERGHGFLGDDYVLVEPGDTPIVHALYRSAKLAPTGRGSRSRFACLAPSGEADPDGKDIFLANKDSVVQSAPLRAVIAPVIGTAEFPVLTLISSAETVRRAAPSILRQMPGMEPQKLALLSRIVRALPCYRLDLCPDHGRNIAAVERLVANEAVVHRHD